MEKRLVFLSSGWGGFDFTWTYLSKKFQRAGYDVIWASYPKRGVVEIEQTSEKVNATLTALNNEYEKIIFIGHSMGGLVGRTVIQMMDGANNIDLYASLGTPHQGSPVARLAPVAIPWSRSAIQMRQDSEFLTMLNGEPWPEHINALTISGAWDSLVWPQERATFSAAKDHTHVPRTTHTGLLLQPRVFSELWAWMTYGQFDEVGFDEKPGYVSKVEFDE